MTAWHNDAGKSVEDRCLQEENLCFSRQVGENLVGQVIPDVHIAAAEFIDPSWETLNARK